MLQGVGRYRYDAGHGLRHDVGPARVFIAPNYCHLAEAFAWNQCSKLDPLFADTQFAAEKEREEIATFAVPHDNCVGGGFVPTREAHYFPKLNVGKFTEKR